MKTKYSRELLAPIVKDSYSVAQVIRKLGLKQSGGNHSYLTDRIKAFDIDTSHFLGAMYNSVLGNFCSIKLSPDQVLVNDRLRGRRDSAKMLRRALLESGVEHKCAVCGLLPYWNGKYLQLQIDHISGITTDNRIENLRFICGNCHLQTDTFGSLNINGPNKNEKISSVETLKVILPVHIPNPNWRTEPKLKQRKVSRPSKEELEKLLWEKPTVQLAIDFGVSDNAIGKWAKSYGIEKPPRGYWAKSNKN